MTDKETTQYIISHYGTLFNINEKLAFKHQQSLLKLDDPSGGLSEVQKERRRDLYLRQGWLTNNAEILNLLQHGYEHFELKVASRILTEHKDQVFFNFCPQCAKLARTPQARQCRHCNHDWH